VCAPAQSSAALPYLGHCLGEPDHRRLGRRIVGLAYAGSIRVGRVHRRGRNQARCERHGGRTPRRGGRPTKQGAFAGTPLPGRYQIEAACGHPNGTERLQSDIPQREQQTISGQHCHSPIPLMLAPAFPWVPVVLLMLMTLRGAAAPPASISDFAASRIRGEAACRGGGGVGRRGRLGQGGATRQRPYAAAQGIGCSWPTPQTGGAEGALSSSAAHRLRV
jgi:hypothetical protein